MVRRGLGLLLVAGAFLVAAPSGAGGEASGDEGRLHAHERPGVQQAEGCDAPLQGYSCTDLGQCCDDHDRCILRHCPLGCGSALEPPARGLRCPVACEACHTAVRRCFLTGLARGGPGPSRCCALGICGQATRCFEPDTGVTYQDPCECMERGLGILRFPGDPADLADLCGER